MKEQSKVKEVNNRFTSVLFFIYLALLCWILLLKLGVRFSYMSKRSVNLIPFNGHFVLTSENILNIIVFVPLGVYAGILFEKWIFGRKLLFVFLLSLFIEALQYIFRIGAFDITDIITNTAGGVIGLIIFKALKKAFNNSVKAQKFINKIAAAGTVLIILLLALLKMDMLPIRYQ